MSQTEEKKHNTNAIPVLKDYAKATAKYPGFFLMALLGILLATATNIAAPLYLKDFINLLTEAGAVRTGTTAILMALGFYTIATFLNWLAIRIQMIGVINIEARIESDLTNKAFGHLIHHGHDFFANNFAGSLTRRVGRYAHAYPQIFGSLIEGMLPTLLFAVGVITVLFMQHVWLGLGLLLWTIFFLIFQYVITKWRYQFKLERAKQDSRVTGALADSIGNHSAIVTFGAEQEERSRVRTIVGDWYKATLRSWNSDVLTYGIQGFLTRGAQVGLLIASFYLWSRGSITVGDVVLIQIYILSLMDQIMSIGRNMRQLYDALAEANEMIDIMQEPHTIADAPNAKRLAVTHGEVAFENVSFSFTDSYSVLNEFSLTIGAHEKLALVGPSGAGKSTIIKLLLRLHDVSGGAIRIDGQDIREITQESLRKAISFVPQEPALFHRTLRENIAYGNLNATEEEIIEAARKAHCHEFIAQLPMGYDTYVGERGIKLSGGERQRVAIARAILKDAPILVLDEATSSLDSESEALIQDALKTLMEGKTVVVIAHRLSTIMSMDRILVIEAGKIVSEGTHAELFDRKGELYHKLWSIQAGGFIAE